MGYTQEGSFDELFRDGPLVDAAHRTTERVGEVLRTRVRERTPVARPPAASVAAEWLAARKRVPGTLRESWQVGEVEVIDGGALMRVPVLTHDPTAPHVEWDTMPHLIAPRRAGGWLRYWDTAGRTVFAQLVRHPGTRGVHMMSTALVEVAAEWQRIGAEELERWAREQVAA